jgi:hypothetical protein
MPFWRNPNRAVPAIAAAVSERTFAYPTVSCADVPRVVIDTDPFAGIAKFLSGAGAVIGVIFRIVVMSETYMLVPSLHIPAGAVK